MTKYKFLFFTILYAGGILWFSFQPDYPTAAPPNTWMMMFKDFLHIPAYAGLVGLMFLTYEAWRMEHGEWRMDDKGRRIRLKGETSPFALGERRAENGERRTDNMVYGRWSMDHGLVFRFFRYPLSILHSPTFVVFIIATLFGILNEFVQAHVPGRFYSIGDMVRNAVGAGIGLWIVKRWIGMADIASD